MDRFLSIPGCHVEWEQGLSVMERIALIAAQYRWPVSLFAKKIRGKVINASTYRYC